MNDLRSVLVRDLTDAIDAHHLVVWQDETGAFEDVARELVPAGCRFEAFEDSWVALRHRVECRCQVEALLADGKQVRLT